MFNFLKKKAQLGMIEFQYLLGGFVIGLIIGLVVAYLIKTGVIPFSFLYTCPKVGP